MEKYKLLINIASIKKGTISNYHNNNDCYEFESAVKIDTALYITSDDIDAAIEQGIIEIIEN